MTPATIAIPAIPATTLRATLFALPVVLAMSVPEPVVAVTVDAPDYVLTRVPDPAAPPPVPGHRTADFQRLTNGPAKWPGPVRWRYNATNAPATFSSNGAAAVQVIANATAKWSAVCGIGFVYDGETGVPPNNVTGGFADGVNVIGWGPLASGTTGVTYSAYTVVANGDWPIIDSDIVLNPSFVTSASQLDRTVSHEWGHAIGLGHSNFPDTLMSGLPYSPYSNAADLTADDVRGCRCVYGPASGQQAGYVCSLPPNVDFGEVDVGTASSPHRVTVTNSGNAPLVVNAPIVSSTDFVVAASGCASGSLLAPGASCAFDVRAQPTVAGPLAGEIVMGTSDGSYRLPLRADATASPPIVANHEGLWWAAPANSESGWGINFAHQGEVIFATWFTYDANGKAWWLTMAATQTGPASYAGTLYQSQGPAFNAEPFDPARVTRTAVGSATLGFSDAGNGTFAYTVNGVSQAKAITRQVFGPLPVCAFGAQPNLALAANFQDLWYASPPESEAGWGVNFTHQGDIIFATWFTYDFDGSPLWLSATAGKTGPGSYAGTLYRTTGPAFNALPFDPTRVARSAVGTLALSFADGNRGSYGYTVTLGPAAQTVSQVKAITRQVFRSPGTVCQ